MEKKEIPFRGHIIEQWRFGSQMFYYPAFNGNAEFATFRDCCSYVRRIMKYQNEMRQTLTFLQINL